MNTRLGRAIILVDDYDKALAFYENAFNCKVLFDQTTSTGQRLLHVGFSENDLVGVWFLKAEGEEQRKLIGKQTGGQPTLVIYTDDVEALYYHVQQKMVRVIEPLTVARESKYFHCFDLYGNRITVVELT